MQQYVFQGQEFSAERVAAQPGQNQAHLRPVNHDLPILLQIIPFIYFYDTHLL